MTSVGAMKRTFAHLCECPRFNLQTAEISATLDQLDRRPLMESKILGHWLTRISVRAAIKVVLPYFKGPSTGLAISHIQALCIEYALTTVPAKYYTAMGCEKILNFKPGALLAGAALPAGESTSVAQVRLRSLPYCDVTHSGTLL